MSVRLTHFGASTSYLSLLDILPHEKTDVSF